ncbi:GntR family transcriptional regulator [Plastoroseomonas hellenica]|uniref:GntR family transcriptional regulator n=1 Tax=Plastoroseomonas hellenica TaxID=2687306 RepID=UPI001BADF982|nr:GntR family transcriptional regulator [Plastoroseomonas hellenica]MBR0641521.1 GntR family transcriptional regulator [Plastoroseomonas hellenica]
MEIFRVPHPSSARLPDAAEASRPASAVVADALRRQILRGALPEGERLRQDAVAIRFGVSQMIAREAFRQLVAEGVLTAEARRGVSVAHMNPEEAWETTQLRSLIEAQALEWAIPLMTKADLAMAERSLGELDTARSTDRIIALNARFHEALYAPARRERTLAMIATLRINFERYLRFTWDETEHLEQSQREHRAILDACRLRDAAQACALLKQHVRATGDLLVQRLRARRAG